VSTQVKVKHKTIEELIQEAETLCERRSTAALPIIQDAMEMALQSGTLRHIALAKYVLGFYHCFVENNYDEAVKSCDEALKHLNQKEISEFGYKMYLTLGNSYQLKGDVYMAQKSYLMGIKSLESKEDLKEREWDYLASFYYNLGLLLGNSAFNFQVEEYLTKAIEIYERIGQRYKLSKSYVAFCSILEPQGKFNECIDLLMKAKAIDEEENDQYSIALTNANLGIMYMRLGNETRSLYFLGMALEYYQASNMAYETAMVKTSLAEAVFKGGKQDEGITIMYEAEELFRQLNNKKELSNIAGLLSSMHEANNNFSEALKCQKRYTESLKEFFDVEKTNSITRAKKEFETEQKEKEASLLREKNDEINRYVHKLEMSNNELKQFAQVASHDLREPLRMISSYMTLLEKSLKDNLNEQQKDFINFASDGARRMEQLIVDLLRLAKIDANPKLEDVKLSNVIEEIKLNLDTLLKEKNAIVVVSDMPMVKADRTQMLQLFQNLIGNGVKYNESDQPLIRINCVTNFDKYEITISDNGIGIPETFKDKIFNIFQRVPTNKSYSGSGIGLAICKKIVDSMNGKIWVENNPTGGTLFKINLKVAY
jgi:nitrogen-specific signal transduction histidine kinase